MFFSPSQTGEAEYVQQAYVWCPYLQPRSRSDRLIVYKKRGHWGMPPLTKKEKAAEKLKRLSPQQEKERRRDLLRKAMKKDKEQRETPFQL